MFFQSKFKTLAITTVIASLLLIGVNSSDAASITSLSVYAYDDWGAGATISATLTTDEDVDYIDWYVNGIYQTTSMHSGTTSVYVDLGTFSGHLKGKKYTVSASAYFWDDENNEFVSDSDSDVVRVFKPEYSDTVDGNDGNPRHPDIYGYVVL